MSRFPRWLLPVAVLAGLAWWTHTPRPIARAPGILAAAAPVQQALDAPAPALSRAGAAIRPLAKFSLSARVLSRNDYRWDAGARLAPIDLALGWGRMSDSAVLDRIEISQGSRFYFWHVQAFPIPEGDATAIARGKYLVTLASCSECHTPTYQLQPLTHLAFAGGTSLKGPWGDVNSANITPDPSGISYYDEALFIQTLRTGHVGARKLSSIMPWGYFRNLTDDDLKAIFAYLRTLPPVRHRVDNTEVPTACPVCGKRHGHGELNH